MLLENGKEKLLNMSEVLQSSGISAKGNQLLMKLTVKVLFLMRIKDYDLLLE